MKTAIVTGATRGIGRATAVGLGALGYHVVVTGRTRREGDAAALPEASALAEFADLAGSLATTVDLIKQAGGHATPLVLDLLERDTLQPVALAAIEALGHVDVLVNNAIYVGPAGTARFLDTPPDELERRLYANVAAQLVFMQPILRHMVERRDGVIADVTSAAGYATPTRATGEGGWALSYGVSKAGLHRIVEQLVVEHPDDGVRFLNVQPGFVATERVLAAGATLQFVADHAAPVEIVGRALARIVDSAPDFPQGALVQIQDHARNWGLLPA